jgi:hypothetical protein
MWSVWGSNPGGGEIFADIQTGSGAHPSSYTVYPLYRKMGGPGYFPGVNRPRRGVDHPPNLVPRLKKE